MTSPVDAFQNILGIGKRDVASLIARLNPSYNDEMQTTQSSVITAALPSVKLLFPDGSEVPTDPRVRTGTTALITVGTAAPIKVTYIGGGTYGEIWQSPSDRSFLFKRVIPHPSKTFENQARNFFCECWVQTILNQDPVYGQYTSKIYSAYRDHRIINDRDSNGRKIVHGEPIFFLRMEYIPYTMASVVESESFRERQARGILYTLAKYLDHFQEKYGFYHRDLHVGNMMMTDTGLKIIDFGMSCLTYNGVNYRMPDSDACSSVDLLIFLTSMREQVTSSEVKELLDDIMTSPLDGIKIYKSLQAVPPNDEPVFWKTYSWAIPRLPRIIRDSIKSTPAFTPKGLIEDMEYYYSENSVTGLRLSTRFPWLKKIKYGLLGLSTSPEENVENTISSAKFIQQQRGRGRSTRRLKKTRKHKYTRKH